jgi:TolB-like protein/Flp pilus assembly protein TadD/DNA-binding winged helix-turn-helix (wHTH) protein
MNASTSATASHEAGYRVDDLIVDIGRQRVTRDCQEIPLSQLSFELLVALARAAPNVLSFDELMERVWPGLVVTPETVSQRVKLVRDALDDDPHSPHYILGVRGRGYRMLAEVSPLTSPLLAQVTAATARETATSTAEAVLASESVPADDSLPQSPSQAHDSRSDFRRRQLSLLGGAALLGALAWLTVYYSLLPGRSAHWAAPPADSSVVVEEPKTIAVLPLVDISPSGGNQYLGDGLAQELSSRLARIPGVRVAAQTSANAFRGRSLDVRTIAGTLGVQHVLEGSLRKEGEHLRVTAELIDAGTGYRVWSRTYDREWKDLLMIEDDLSRSIIQVLQVVLSYEVAARVARRPTAHVQAFDLYLSGLAKLQEPAEGVQMDAAEGVFLEALKIDPHFALAYAGLCECYTLRYERDRDIHLAARAEQSCNQALSMDASLREVNMALAHLYLVGGRNDQAAAIYRNVVGQNPVDADAYIGLAESYAGQHRLADAEHAYRRAIDSEPDYRDAETAYGNFLLEQGRATEAVTHFRRVTEIAPGSAPAFNNLGAALEMTGDLHQASQAIGKSLELEPTRSAYSNSGTVYYFMGRYADAARMFRKASDLASADHRVWGNLADALYQMPTEREVAVSDYRRAITLAESALGVNPQDALTLIQLAYYYSRVGDTSHVSRYSERARQLGPDEVYVHYYGALIAIQQQNTAAAIAELRRAMDLGFPAQLVRAAPEFVSLRGEQKFEQLLASGEQTPTG